MTDYNRARSRESAVVLSEKSQLRRGDKSLVGNTGYRRYLGGDGPDHFRIDEAKVAEDARSDGKWVLRTNIELDSSEVALQYKQFVDGGALVPLVQDVAPDPIDLPPV